MGVSYDELKYENADSNENVETEEGEGELKRVRENKVN